MSSESSLEDQIRKEIADKSAELANRGVPEDEREALFFNNFHLNLPEGGRERNHKDYLDDPRFNKAGGQTLRQFYDDVSRVVEGFGLGYPIRDIQPAKKLDVRRKLFELAFPVYVKLREMGYTHKDLVA